MSKYLIILLVIFSLLLAACASAAADIPTETVEVITEVAGGEDVISTAVSTIPAASATPNSSAGEETSDANCTVVSRQPTPGPTEQALVPLASNEDWSHGPDDAAVTFIEYGDFQ